jgi:hypothetical protein
MKNSKDTIRNRSRDLPVCSAVPQPLRHRVPPDYVKYMLQYICKTLASNAFSNLIAVHLTSESVDQNVEE